jgi:lipopolysaccharide biosynthesis regulator YciM
LVARQNQAQRRAALAAAKNDVATGATPSDALSLDQIVQDMQQYVPGALKTLGEEAANGNVQAAKTILDFLATASRERMGSKGTDMLAKIAQIRRAPSGPPDST